jgi:hypothetical protein
MILILIVLNFRCEKGLDTNSYITLYQLESGSKRLVDGIGYDVHTDYEVMLVESSG